MRTLAALAESRGGQLEFPAVTVTDYPTLGWRGVHNFVGPTALDFQTKLMQRVLAPMKLNKMVVQCERTNFEAIRGTETAITMDKGDLATLFDRYREHGIEPIPLVQSLGHAGWIFENGQNLDIAINPNVPFTMDPRKARTRQLLTDLWKEVVETTKAKTVHFGMDEISNRGLPDDPSFTTRIWRQHVPFLNGLARDMGVGKMMWGDIMLHPSEAPDAAHAKTLESARERRAVLERGTYIADWHYKDDSRPETFKSLEVWKNAGMRPIASTWFRPNNIRGFALAAARADAGLLQTTWAGYESSEANMIRAFPQFSAYLLAADYAWSGRTELPKDLGYDPEEVLQAMYFSAPQAVKPMPGRKILLEGSEGRERQIGPYRFRIDRPVQLKGVTEDAAFFAPNELTVNVRAQARQVVLVVDTLARLREMTDVAEVRVLTTGGIYRATMAYGSHVRAVTDPRSSMVSPREAGLSAFVVDIPNEVTVEAVVVEVKNRAAGLRVHGVTVL